MLAGRICPIPVRNVVTGVTPAVFEHADDLAECVVDLEIYTARLTDTVAYLGGSHTWIGHILGQRPWVSHIRRRNTGGAPAPDRRQVEEVLEDHPHEVDPAIVGARIEVG